MENNLIIEEQSGESNNSGLSINQNTREHFVELRKWTMFLSITGFVFVVIMALCGIFMGALMTELIGGGHNGGFPGILIGVVYVILSIIYFFPILFLFQFSNRMKTALEHSDHEWLEASFRSLIYHYRFMGIMTIIVVGIYAIGFLILGATAIF